MNVGGDPVDSLAALLPMAEYFLAGVLLAMARTGGFFLALPGTATSAVPRIVKAVLIFAVSLALIWASPSMGYVQLGPSPELAILVAAVGEFILGLGLGFIIHLALATARIAGEVAGVEMGLSFSAVADPLSGGHATAASALFAHLAVQLFMALGLDHTAIRALAVSADAQPFGAADLAGSALLMLANLGSVMVEGALSLALPLMGGLFSLKIAMAMLARVAPRLQIFTLAFALSILMGILILDAALGSIAGSMANQLGHWMKLLVRLASASS